MTDALPAGHPTNSIEAFIVGKLNRRKYIYMKKLLHSITV